MMVLCRELREAGVKVVQPDASYYMFPDFEVLREALARKGITTCEHMCQAMLDETNVAVSLLIT
jgi:aspartate aminotransferase